MCDTGRSWFSGRYRSFVVPNVQYRSVCVLCWPHHHSCESDGRTHCRFDAAGGDWYLVRSRQCFSRYCYGRRVGVSCGARVVHSNLDYLHSPRMCSPFSPLLAPLCLSSTDTRCNLGIVGRCRRWFVRSSDGERCRIQSLPVLLHRTGHLRRRRPNRCCHFRQLCKFFVALFCATLKHPSHLRMPLVCCSRKIVGCDFRQ